MLSSPNGLKQTLLGLRILLGGLKSIPLKWKAYGARLKGGGR